MSPIKTRKKRGEFGVRLLRRPPEKPQALTVGLPGLGLVGAGAASLLITRSVSTPVEVASIASGSGLSTAPSGQDGILRPNEFSMDYVQPRSDAPGVLVLAGRAQPPSSTSQFAFAETVLHAARRLEVDWVLTLGGYQVPAVSEERHIYVAANDLLTYRLGVESGMRQLSGQVTGAAGVIAGLSRYMGFHGGCILAETDGKPPDLKASEAVFSSFVGFLSRIGQSVPP